MGTKALIWQYVVLAAVGVSALIGATAWQASAETSPSWMAYVPAGAVVIALGLASRAIMVRHRARVRRSDPEQATATAAIHQSAAALTFRDAFVLGAAIWAGMIFAEPPPAAMAWLLMGYMAIVAITYGIHLGVLRERLAAGEAPVER